jgi:hypothetical protein
MRARRLTIVLAAVLLTSCGESRYQPTTPGAGTGGLPGSGIGQGGSSCHTVATMRQCVGRGGSDVILAGVQVAGPASTLALQLPAEYASARRAQAFEAVLVGNGRRFEFRRPGEACAVVPDIPGLDAVQVRDMGVLTGVPAGTYELRIEHGLDNPCYTPPPDADPTASNYIVVGSGELTVCNP